MSKLFFLLAGTMFLSLALHAQQLDITVQYVTADGSSNNNIIFYQPGSLLSWSDFRGKPVEGSDAAALSSAGFGIKLAFRRVGNTSDLLISVTCSFSKKDSWVLPGNKTPYILNHEQKHFDIAYIHTLLFIEKLRKAPFTNTNYGSLIEKIYNESAIAMGKFQNQYDAETSHSRIPEKQLEWDQKISTQLTLTEKITE